jgi:hypothetical protein
VVADTVALLSSAPPNPASRALRPITLLATAHAFGSSAQIRRLRPRPDTHAAFRNLSLTRTAHYEDTALGSARPRAWAWHATRSVGKEAVRKGILDAGGAKALGAEPGVAGAVFEGLEVLHPPSERPVPLDLGDPDDLRIAERLRETLGDFFAERLMDDAAWARGVLAES